MSPTFDWAFGSRMRDTQGTASHRWAWLDQPAPQTCESKECLSTLAAGFNWLITIAIHSLANRISLHASCVTVDSLEE